MLPEPKYLNLEYFYNWISTLSGYVAVIVITILDWVARHNFRNLSVFISGMAIIGAIYASYKIYKLRRKRLKDFVNIFEIESVPENRSARWKEIKTHLSSDSLAQWKIAILEADSLLDDILIRIGYPGENMGERLKSIEPSDFNSLQDVWEAHKTRNRIAHESGVVITKGEAERVIAKFEKALKELKYL